MKIERFNRIKTITLFMIFTIVVGYFITIPTVTNANYDKSKASEVIKDIVYPVADKNPVQTSGYGSRWGKLHAGVDIAKNGDATGTPIVAVADGVIVEMGNEKQGVQGYGGYGGFVLIDHKNYYSFYAHQLNNPTKLKAGDKVKAGQKIGEIGNTGASTGAHLHFEFRFVGKGGGKMNSNTTVDPAPYMKKAKKLDKPSKDGISTGGDKEEKDDSKEEKKGFNKYKSPFIEKKAVMNKKGLKGTDVPMGAETTMKITQLSETFYDMSLKIAVYMVIAFFVYTSACVVWYFAVSFRNGYSSEKFAKIAGIPLVVNKESKLNLLGRWGLSLVIVIVFLAELYVPLMHAIYIGLYKIGIF